MAFRLTDYESADLAKEALYRELPKGTPRETVLPFLKSANIPCFDEKADVLACRVIEPSANMVHVVWQIAIHFDGVDRRDSKTLQIGYVLENLLCQRAEFRRARQIGAVTCEIDTRQHDLGMTCRDQRAHLIDDGTHRDRTGISTTIGNNAKRAAMVAAVLHLNEHPRQAAVET